jgi:signal transduction histidine kinase
MSKGEVSDDKLEAARAEERKRLAREVHDRLGGDLSAVKMALAVLARRLPQESGLHEQLDYVDKLVDGAIDSMHHISEKWQGASEDAFAQVVQLQVDTFRKQSGLDCQCTAEDVPLDPGSSAAEALSRILRECLVNIGKHAGAQHVRVALRAAQGHIILSVQDDGVGIGTGLAPALAGARPGMGLRAMRERVTEQGGSFSMRAAAPRGTLMTVELPLAGQLLADKTAGSP